MSRVILKAECHNWSLMGPGDISTEIWKIRNDGSYSLEIFIMGGVKKPSRVVQGSMAPDDYESLFRKVGEEWSDEKTYACDGDVWEFKLYGEKGRLEKYRPIGYIYGIEPYEGMASILAKYREEIPAQSVLKEGERKMNKPVDYEKAMRDFDKSMGRKTEKDPNLKGRITPDGGVDYTSVSKDFEKYLIRDESERINSRKQNR